MQHSLYGGLMPTHTAHVWLAAKQHHLSLLLLPHNLLYEVKYDDVSLKLIAQSFLIWNSHISDRSLKMTAMLKERPICCVGLDEVCWQQRLQSVFVFVDDLWFYSVWKRHIFHTCNVWPFNIVAYHHFPFILYLPQLLFNTDILHFPSFSEKILCGWLPPTPYLDHWEWNRPVWEEVRNKILCKLNLFLNK